MRAHVLFALLLLIGSATKSQSLVTENNFPAPGQCGVQAYESACSSISTVDFPWSVLIKYSKKGRNDKFACDGVIINENYILTAAHCISNRTTRQYIPISVRLGENDLSSEMDCQCTCADPVVDISIDEAIPHENYNVRTRKDDIGLIRLARPIEFSDFIKPICLPFGENFRNKSYDNVAMIVSGFGKNDAGLKVLKRKQDVVVYNSTKCAEIYSSRGSPLDSTQICAADSDGIDTCSAEGGGGLQANYHNTQYPYTYLVGLVSFGNTACGVVSNFPAVYARVDQYLDWIMANMKP